MSQDAPTRYPLAWPVGRPRTKSRRVGKFVAAGRPITLPAALGRLSAETERLRALYPLLSSNLETRLDGSLVLNRGMPADPGVCLYFSLKGEQFALACDTYDSVAQNIAALAAHIEATRSIERHGVASASESLAAFAALPAPAAVPAPARPWWDVLGLTSADALALLPVRATPDDPGTLSDGCSRSAPGRRRQRRGHGGADPGARRGYAPRGGWVVMGLVELGLAEVADWRGRHHQPTRVAPPE